MESCEIYRERHGRLRKERYASLADIGWMREGEMEQSAGKPVGREASCGDDRRGFSKPEESDKAH